MPSWRSSEALAPGRPDARLEARCAAHVGSLSTWTNSSARRPASAGMMRRWMTTQLCQYCYALDRPEWAVVAQLVQYEGFTVAAAAPKAPTLRVRLPTVSLGRAGKSATCPTDYFSSP